MEHGVSPEAISGWMAAFEHSGLGVAARSTTWLYPLANLIHVLGAALMVGAILAFDIQVLRRLRGIPGVARATLPVAAVGLFLQVASGFILLSAEASTIVLNPAFQLKMAMLALGLINIAVFHWRFGRIPQEIASLGSARALAGVSLASWVIVLLSGRAIAYV